MRQATTISPRLFLAAAVITRIGPEACEPALAAEPSAGEPRIRNQKRRRIKNRVTAVTPVTKQKSPAFPPVLRYRLGNRSVWSWVTLVTST